MMGDKRMLCHVSMRVIIDNDRRNLIYVYFLKPKFS